MRRDQAFVRLDEIGGHRRRDQRVGRGQELDLDAIGVREDAADSAADLTACQGPPCRPPRRARRDRRAVRAVVEDRRAEVADVRASSARVADGEIAHLAIGRQIAEQDEVAEPALERLRVQLRVEHAHVEARRRCDVGHDHVEVIDLGRVDRQQAAAGLPARRCGQPPPTAEATRSLRDRP